jgi:hypothetical protein
MRTLARIFVPLLIGAPVAAQASALAYSFTGAVTNQSGIYSGIANGTSVSGTFTLDYALANPAQSAGVVGSSSWHLTANSGAYNGTTPSALVLSTTLHVGSLTYSTSALDPYLDQSTVIGANGDFIASESVRSSGVAGTGSSIYLFASGANYAYAADGLPTLLGTGGTASITTYGSAGDSILNFSIASLTPAPVPLPAAAWLLISGIGALGAIGRKSGLRGVGNSLALKLVALGL